jgi:hypothetical protein
MEEKYLRRVVIMSLAGLLFGSLFYIFGLSIQSSIIPGLVNYVIALLLYISSFLVAYNNNKKTRISILVYIQFLAIFFILLTTVVTISQIL